MILNAVMARILRYSIQFGSFGANYVTVVEDMATPFATEMLSKESSFQ